MKNKYIIVGPGASGKDWLQKKMIEMGYKPMKQYTTREKRDNETGDEYHFITDNEFKKMDDDGKFFSINFYAIGWYGISYKELMASDVAILSPANIFDLFRYYPGLRNKFTIIYLDMPVELRRRRLASRYTGKVGDNNERRIASDERDFSGFTTWDICIKDEKSVDDFINNLFPLQGE